MNGRSKFFSLSQAKQPVSAVLCGIFLASWVLWLFVYYFSKTAQSVDAYQTASVQQFNQALGK